MSAKAQAGRTARARGRQRERAVAALMRSEGWIVGDMNQSKGGGDLMASRDHGILDHDVVGFVTAEVRLVEVKSTARPFSHFLPADRRSMLEVAERAGATAWLAHWPKGGKLEWIPSERWPA
jgi:Holliday junction resolvase